MGICNEKRKERKKIKINNNIKESKERKDIVKEVFIPGCNPTILEEIFNLLHTCIVRVEFKANNDNRIFKRFFMKIK